MSILLDLFREEDVRKPSLVFCRTRRQAAELAAELSDGSLRVEFVHAGLAKAAQRAHLASIREGRLDIVCCTDVWSTGVDIPQLGSVVLACGGSAPIGLLQRVGRGARRAEGKADFQVWDLAAWDDTRQAARATILYGQGIVEKPSSRQQRKRRVEPSPQVAAEETRQAWLALEKQRREAKWDLLASLAGLALGGAAVWLLASLAYCASSLLQ